MRWKYETDENPKRKHHWSEDYAGFVKVGDTLVGKCPGNLSMQDCESLLNTGISWHPDRWRKNYPKRIYNIRDGVVYRATPTVGGVSYHGFPERPEQFPAEIEPQLLQLADQLGCGNEVRKWLKES